METDEMESVVKAVKAKEAELKAAAKEEMKAKEAELKASKKEIDRLKALLSSPDRKVGLAKHRSGV